MNAPTPKTPKASKTRKTAALPESLWASLANARIYDLAQGFEVGMPQSPNHPAFHMALVRRHGDVVRVDGASAANEMIVTGGHVGTHIDALCHVSQDGFLYQHVATSDVTTNKGFTQHSVDQIPPFVGRGVFLDVAKLRGVAVLEPGEAVTAADLDAAQAAAGVRIGPGDAVLIGTGWSTLWGNKSAYEGQNSGAPGPDESAADWIVRAAFSRNRGLRPQRDCRPTRGGDGAARLHCDHCAVCRRPADCPRLRCVY